MTAELTNPAALLAAAPAPQAAGNVLTPQGPAVLAGATTARDGAGQAEPSDFSNFIRDLSRADPLRPVAPGASPENNAPAPAVPELIGFSPPVALPNALALPATESQPADGGLLPDSPTPGSVLPDGGNTLPPGQPQRIAIDPTPLAPAAPTRPDPSTSAVGELAEPQSAPPPVTEAPGRIVTTATDQAVPIARARPDAFAIQSGKPELLPTELHAGSASNDGQHAPEQQFSDQAARLMEKLGVARESLQQSNNVQISRFSLQAEPGVTGVINVNNSATADFIEPMPDLRQLTAQTTLQPAADHGRFATGLGERLMLMSQNGVQSAQLKLHPEHLGPLDVRIHIENDVAQVWFGAQHGQTREALETALPRLREMFAEQGIQLAHADVESRDQGDRSAHDNADRTNRASDPVAAGYAFPETGPAILAAVRSSNRLLDVYA